MRRWGLICIAMLCAAVVTTGCAKKDLIEKKDRQIADLDENVQTLENRVDQLESELEEKNSINAELEKSLADLKDKQNMWIEQREGLMHITLDGSANFATARADLTGDARKVIDRLGEALDNYPDRWILIEGHADRRPIAESWKSMYDTNWELSTARANSVRRHLLAKNDVEPARVKVVGMGDHHPVDDRSTAEAWAKNRRVEITIGSRLDVEKYMASRTR